MNNRYSSYTDYTVTATYTYDLNDGNGVHEATTSLLMHTAAKTEPTYTVSEQDKSHDWISVITTETDPAEGGGVPRQDL